MFGSGRCEPCRELRTQLEGLRKPAAVLVSVDADAEPEAVRRHDVGELPTLVFFKAGRELHRFKGGALPQSTLELMPAEGD
jgi:thioredoxin-like negative regulator of GroEL